MRQRRHRGPGGLKTPCGTTLGMSVLGHTLQPNRSTVACVRSDHVISWRAFWGNCGEWAPQGLSRQARVSSMKRCEWPVLAYRAPCWQLTARTMRLSHRAQRRMFAVLGSAASDLGEHTASFAWRRARSAPVDCRAAWLWSDKAWASTELIAEMCSPERGPRSSRRSMIGLLATLRTSRPVGALARRV